MAVTDAFAVAHGYPPAVVEALRSEVKQIQASIAGAQMRVRNYKGRTILHMIVPDQDVGCSNARYTLLLAFRPDHPKYAPVVQVYDSARYYRVAEDLKWIRVEPGEVHKRATVVTGEFIEWEGRLVPWLFAVCDYMRSHTPFAPRVGRVRLPRDIVSLLELPPQYEAAVLTDLDETLTAFPDLGVARANEDTLVVGGYIGPRRVFAEFFLKKGPTYERTFPFRRPIVRVALGGGAPPAGVTADGIVQGPVAGWFFPSWTLYELVPVVAAMFH